MVAAQNATASFRALDGSGRTFTIDMYVSDVAAAACTFNANGAAVAGSPALWKPPVNVQLYDVSIVTGLTATVGVIFQQDYANVAGSPVRFANQLNTLPYRSPLSLTFPAGANIGAIQF